MRRIVSSQSEPLQGLQSTRAIEAAATAQWPPHTLMARAGLALANLTRALAPHSRTLWVACGPGNNGGDGLQAAAHLHQFFQAQGGHTRVEVTLAGDPALLPSDAAAACAQALAAGVSLAPQPPDNFDFAIDALLGIGACRAPTGVLAAHLQALHRGRAPVLCVDLPSGLNADTGQWPEHWSAPTPKGPRHTLSLLTLKPGLFTAHGRDAAGEVWFDDLGVASSASPPDAWLVGMAGQALSRKPPHSAHKGSHGEVLIVGGQAASDTAPGMTGAALLAARAALQVGAGRVYVHLLGSGAAPIAWDPVQPELMFRHGDTLWQGDLIERSAVVCGCGGGESVGPLLPRLLERSQRLVLDADALNAVATDPALHNSLRARRARGCTTVITPHPLEAARLLSTTTEQVMADRIAAAQTLSERLGVICVLKGSGTVSCEAGQVPLINGSGNGCLATAGTGDVLAGMVGAALCADLGDGASALSRVAQAVFQHGQLADDWVRRHGLRPLTAHELTAER